MRRHTPHTRITEALSLLDPAPSADLTEAERDRADAAFARIVATIGAEAVPAAPGRPRRRRRRLLLAAGLAGAVGVAIPGLLPGGSAYGSWTPTPASLTTAAAAAAATTCRAHLAAPDKGERVAVAERRGAWTYVLLAGPGTEAVCLMPDDLVGKDTAVRGDFFGSYDSDAPTPPTVDPEDIDETTSTQGSTDEGWFIWTEGYVGSDVTGVTVHTSAGLDIEASVTGNRFAAWWPSSKQSSSRQAETWWYTVQLADGSTRTVR
jgi:hypothetical protein